MITPNIAKHQKVISPHSGELDKKLALSEYSKIIGSRFHRKNLVQSLVSRDSDKFDQILEYCGIIGVNLAKRINYWADPLDSFLTESNYQSFRHIELFFPEIYFMLRVNVNRYSRSNTLTSGSMLNINRSDNAESSELRTIIAEEDKLEESIRRALHSTRLSSTSIDAAVNAALTAEFSRSSKSDGTISELPRKVTRGGRVTFQAPGREPIPLYGERDDKSMDAIAFYERYWRPYERAGLLTRALLKEYNESLISSIRYQCKRGDLNPDDFLPPTKSASVDDEIAATGLSHRDIRRFARHLDRREARARADREPE